MKKFLLTLFAIMTIFSANIVIADDFASLENLTPVQKQKLSEIQFNYKNQIDALESQIMQYKDKLTTAKADATKTKEQLALLSGAYERNISTLETQKKQLEASMKNAYKDVLTVEQFQQYNAQQIQVQDAFNQFVKTAK